MKQIIQIKKKSFHDANESLITLTKLIEYPTVKLISSKTYRSTELFLNRAITSHPMYFRVCAQTQNIHGYRSGNL